jgi:hypothetical protein
LRFEELKLTELHFTMNPDWDEPYAVGDRVEVLCDHNSGGDRVRDWLEGVVVQVDAKMLAIQFQDNVYLTDGWMVPDHVLWCPKTSTNIRKVTRRGRAKTRGAKRPARQIVRRVDDDDDE